MGDRATSASFSATERATLHSMAEMFQDKDDRDQLRKIMIEGATPSELVLAYRTQKRLVSFLKAAAGLVVVLGAASAALKGMGLWPTR